MTFTRCILVALLSLLHVGCGFVYTADATEQTAKAPLTDVEAASATLTAMLEVAETGDWKRFVTDYYGELHKAGEGAKRAAAIDELARRFEQRYSTQLIEALRRASKCTPTIDAQGRAVFADKGRPIYILHKDERGRWTFHL